MLDESPIGHKLPSPAVLPPTTQSFLLDNDHPHEVSDYDDDNENDYDDNENNYDDKINNMMITLLMMPLVHTYYLPFSSADVCPAKESTLNSLILKLTTNCKNQIFGEYDGI